MEQMLFLVPVVGLLGLLFAVILRQQVVKEDPGTDKMREIADAIAEGANAFLASEYRILVVCVAVLFFVIGFGTRNWITAGCFLVGSGFSTMAGYLGMNAAIRANSRTANAARTSGMHRALALAFSGGSVMGMAVVGLGLLGVGVLYILTRDVSVLSGFSLGASSIALFARVGGGIYTKAADVGADLVGKVEAGIPEDDPRNPAVIADNVGDNVGDVAGMGADLFESYVGSLISALTLGLVFYQEAGIRYHCRNHRLPVSQEHRQFRSAQGIKNRRVQRNRFGSGLRPYPQPHILRQFHGSLYHHYRFIGRRADWSCH